MAVHPTTLSGKRSLIIMGGYNCMADPLRRKLYGRLCCLLHVVVAVSNYYSYLTL